MERRCHRCGAELEADARFCGLCGTTLVDPNINRVVGGRYVLQEKIGAGSLGIVYRAEQLGLRRKLAIKILPSDSERDYATVERFRREGEVLCRLRSPHTITTYEFDRDDDGSLYIAMELSTGRSLAEVVRTEAPLAWPRVLRILAGLCDSLAEAHELGVVHRDLKPENILLETSGGREVVKVTDFGLAKLLPAKLQVSPVGQTVGAVEYSSPEQLLRRPLDARSDLYALGVLGFLLVTGRHPLESGRGFGGLIDAHINAVPPTASSLAFDVPGDVDAILARCLEKDPARRFSDAPTLAAMIGIVLAQQTADAGETIRTPDIGDEDTVLGTRPDRDRR